MKTATRYATLIAGPTDQRQAEDDRLRDAVEHGPEHDRESAPSACLPPECLRSSPPMRSINVSPA